MIYICLFYFITIFLDFDGNELLQQPQESINRITGNSQSLGEKWLKKEKKVIIMKFILSQ
jgi:hypothetical protein